MYCQPGTSDGAGTLAVLSRTVEPLDAAERVWVIAANGTLLGIVDGRFLQVAPRERGFHVAELELDPTSGRGFKAWALDGAGKLEATLAYAPGEIGDLRSAFGRTQLFTSPGAMDSQWKLSSFDADGRLRFEVEATLGCYWQDRLGNTLGPPGWLDTQGRQGPAANVYAGPMPQGYGISFQPRIEGGFFVHVTDTATERSRWAAQIDSLAKESTEAPAWLARRSDVRVQIVRGGAGYALLPVAGACSQRVEIVTPDGSSCGFVSFPDIVDDCADTSLDVGLDGTVIQQLPPSSGCNWQFWPGYFR